MTDSEIKQQGEVLDAIISACHACGMKPKAGAEDALLAAIAAKGVTASTDETGLVLRQGTTEMVISSALKTLRSEHEDLFFFDLKYSAPDAITCRADFNRGTPQEILARKARWISEHGNGAYENLPADRAEAERRAVVPSAAMTAKQYACLSLADKSRLVGLIGVAGIERIMARR